MTEADREAIVLARLLGILRPHIEYQGGNLRVQPCTSVVPSRVLDTPRVFAPATLKALEPDLLIIREAAQYLEIDGVPTILNPATIVELTTAESAEADRAKWSHYQQIETLEQFVLISSTERRVEFYARRDQPGAYVPISEGGEKAWTYVSVRRGLFGMHNVIVRFDELYGDVVPG